MNDFWCQMCGQEYCLRDGDEPTPYCDRCVHARIAELEAALSDLIQDFVDADPEKRFVIPTRYMLYNRAAEVLNRGTT